MEELLAEKQDTAVCRSHHYPATCFYTYLMSAHLLLISAASGCTVTVADSLYGTVRYDMSVTGIRLALALHCVALPCVALPYEYNRGSEAPRYFWAQVMVIIKGPSPG